MNEVELGGAPAVECCGEEHLVGVRDRQVAAGHLDDDWISG